MIIQRAVLLFVLTAASGFAFAQQTGTVIGKTPQPAVGAQISSTKVTPVATCETPAVPIPNGAAMPAVPEMVFSREWGQLVCVRHPDGRTEELRDGLPWGAVSGNGSEAAYFVPEKRELHVFSIAARTDAIVDVLPGTKKVSGMFWSVKGRSLVYTLEGETSVHLFDLDVARTNVVEGGSTRVVAAPDPKHVLGIGRDGAELMSVDGGKRELVAAVKDADRAQYSQSGALLRILASASMADQAAAAPVSPPSAETEDDSPDCTGGTFALIVQKGKQLLDVPFPEGFDSVLDFQFSPDDQAIAVTFGSAACDYPGEKARVYLVTLPAMTLKPVSPADRMSVEPRWTPDGKTLVYVDYQGSDSRLVASDLQTRKVKRLTSPGQFFGPDVWLAWR
jgi:dipeptidyl aminopeptidase/acylaminoacyl peptidase